MGIRSAISRAVSWATSTVSSISPALKFLKPLSTWISYINMGIMVISWLKKPDTPDTPNMDGQAEQNAKGVLVNKTSSNEKNI